MRLSKLFFRTFKEAPADAEIASQQLMERGGYIRKVGKGLYSYTPLMMRVFKKLLAIIHEELEKAGAQEVLLPSLHPVELWKESGRWDDFASTLLSTIDREGHEFCLAATHEEVVTALVKNWITSYKQLPINLYQVGTKFRDEIRPRFGLMRGKEFLMKDGYSFSISEEEMNAQYALMRQAYSRIFERLELDFVIVDAYGGKIGKGKSEEFQVTADAGEDAVMICGDFASNIEKATALPPVYPYTADLQEKKQVATPGTKTIEELSIFLKVDPQLILKTLVYKLKYTDREEFVAIAIRGDRQLNELKINDTFEAIECTLASEEEVKKVVGASCGFVGPINLTIPFYADQSTEAMTNFVCALCEEDQHFIHINWDRDIKRPEFYDFLFAEAGDGCPHIPGKTYELVRGIEVGHIFNIGTKYSQALEALFQDVNGKTHPFQMGTYGLGIGRTAAACVEQRHDERGIIWPLAIAPFRICLMAANAKDEALTAPLEELYHILQDAGLEPLLDDRAERLGFKLRDSDLVGIPYKLIIGKSFAETGKVEIESRAGEKLALTLTEVLPWAEKALNPSHR